MSDFKRIVTIQDISCVGQCSITVALPVISACGIETSVVPSAVLSTHTGGFTGYTFRDLTEDMPKIREHWLKENLKFDAVYTGYLGSAKQIQYVIDFFDTVGNENCVNIVDPAMADNGKLYSGFDESFVDAMRKLIPKADYLLPNITEACLLTGMEYIPDADAGYIKQLLKKLCDMGAMNVILTGECLECDKTGFVLYNGKEFLDYAHQKLSRSSHGTGDIYASAFTGALMRGKSAYDAAKVAADFVVECIKCTMKDPNHTYGARFEPVLYKLYEMLK